MCVSACQAPSAEMAEVEQRAIAEEIHGATLGWRAAEAGKDPSGATECFVEDLDAYFVEDPAPPPHTRVSVGEVRQATRGHDSRYRRRAGKGTQEEILGTVAAYLAQESLLFTGSGGRTGSHERCVLLPGPCFRLA